MAKERLRRLYGVDAKTAEQNDIADISFTAVETLNILSDVGVVVGTEKLTTTEANTINDISWHNFRAKVTDISYQKLAE